MPVLVRVWVKTAGEAELALRIQVDVLEDDDAMPVQQFFKSAGGKTGQSA